ncbi:MAG TPA: metalloregulator ArsR/SmtB family transcription factor [Polyangiaceae bacterium]|jgi:ArsR family transcriptional regulator|nr:metalloregulator ArsR/SmtB family transcription factor [Polyangiaceae bacterium]
MNLSTVVGTLNLLGDESRLRLCALLRNRELCVSDLVRVTGIAQSRVSTHLGRLRDAGFVHDRRTGTQCFYTLAEEALPTTARAVLDDAAQSVDPTLTGDQERLRELEADRRGDLPDSAADDLERYYSPGRTWQSLAAGIAGLLDLGDVLDAGAGDGAAAATLAPYCASLTCIDSNARMLEAARARLAKFSHARVEAADVLALPFATAAFDTVLLFHTLTYASDPGRAVEECARVLRPGGRLVVLCLDRHEQREITARYGELYPGFSPGEVRELIAATGLVVKTAHVASREAKKPHLRVVLSVAEKPKPRTE